MTEYLIFIDVLAQLAFLNVLDIVGSLIYAIFFPYAEWNVKSTEAEKHAINSSNENWTLQDMHFAEEMGDHNLNESLEVH